MQTMPELRRHYFLDEYCIIAAERGRRPTNFRRDEAKPADEAACPFCPGSEAMTPPSDAVYTGQGILSDGAERVSGWQMRVFPNAFRRASLCPFCSIVEKETGSSRLVGENDGWILIAPFYSLTPFETWILPKRHFSSLGEMSDTESRSLAVLLMQALRAIRSVLNDPPYKLMIFQLPSGYHLNIRIQPAVCRIAGFEKSTGIHINSIAPEYAAAKLSESTKSDGRSPKS